MHTSVYHTFVYGVIGGVFIIILALAFVGYTSSSQNRINKHVVLQAVEYIETGNDGIGLEMLEKLVADYKDKEALRILVKEYSTPEYGHYDITEAVYYAEILKDEDSSYEDLYNEVKRKALENWQPH